MFFSLLISLLFALLLSCGGWILASRLQQHLSSKARNLCFLFGLLLVLLRVILMRNPALVNGTGVVAATWYHLSEWMLLGFIPFFVRLASSSLSSSTLRIGVFLCAALLLFQQSYGKRLGSLLQFRRIQAMSTRWSEDAVCLQNSSYTCGPAAAVSALHHMGIQAEEADLALAAFCSSISGSQAADLSSAIQGLYQLPCRVYTGKQMQKLREADAALLKISLRGLTHHWVALLEWEGDEVILGDPLYGRSRMHVSQVDAIWTHSAILIQQHP